MKSIVTVPRNLTFPSACILPLSSISSSSSSSLLSFTLLFINNNTPIIHIHTRSSSSSSTTSSSSSSAPSPNSSVSSSSFSSNDIHTLQRFLVEPLPRSFARPQSAAGRLVTQIADRRTHRLRIKAADILLDKETTIQKGILTPGIPTISKDSQDSNTVTKTKQYVGLESLGRIERSMSLGKSNGAKAGIRSLITTKTLEINTAESASPVTKLISIIRNAESLGIPLRLRRKEYEMVREYEREHYRTGGGGSSSSAPSMKIPAPPFDFTATKLTPLSNDGKQLRNTLQSTENRATLLQIAKTRLR